MREFWWEAHRSSSDDHLLSTVGGSSSRIGSPKGGGDGDDESRVVVDVSTSYRSEEMKRKKAQVSIEDDPRQVKTHLQRFLPEGSRSRLRST